MFIFAIFFWFILIPLTIIMSLIWLYTRNEILGKTIIYSWVFLLLLMILGDEVRDIFKKKKLTKEDFYGQYVIDRDFFPGQQADWQYDNFRFEILENDSIYFYQTNKNIINKTYKGKISTTNPFGSQRIIVHMNQPTHHILTSNPTIYRNTWDFYMIFNSPKFSNMKFKKGKY